MRNQILALIRNKRVLYGLGVIVIIGIAIALLGNNKPKPQTILVHKGDFVQEVSVSGKVVAAKDVDLGFSQGGRIAGVYVAVGDIVSAGSVLAEIENGDLKASLEAEQAKLDSLNAGTRPEQIAVTQAELDSAQAALVQSNQALADAIRTAYTVGDSAVVNTLDTFITNPHTTPSLPFSVSDASLKTAVETGRATIETPLATWGAHVASITSDPSALIIESQSRVSDIATLLTAAGNALNRAIPTGTVSQSTINAYASDVSAARTSVNTAATTLTSAITAERNAATAVVTAQKNLALEKAGTTSNDIAAQQARVNEAAANYAKTRIVAPFSGIVTTVNAKVGGTLSVNAAAISLIGSEFQIESYVPEVNVALVAIGNKATATLDAYGTGVGFPVKVASIDPAETLKDGVSTYRTILAFTAKDPRIRAGMTANVTIETAKKQDVIAVPQGVVTTATDGTKHVSLLVGDTATDRTVTTGALSSTGTIEILSGLAEGDTIVVNQK